MWQNFGDGAIDLMDQHLSKKLIMFNASTTHLPMECSIDIPANDEHCSFLLLHWINYIHGFGFMPCSETVDILQPVCSRLPGLSRFGCVVHMIVINNNGQQKKSSVNNQHH